MRRLRFGKSLFVGALAVAALGATSAAHADGMDRKAAPVYDKPVSWSGFYVGAQAGYSWSDIDARFISNGATYSVDNSQAAYGLVVGLQHQWGSVVVGVEADISAALRDTAGVTFCPNPALLCTERFDDVVTLGGRLGWAVGKWMPYITGGYASAAFTHQSVAVLTQVPNVSSRDRYDGWYLGVGLDWIVAPSWVLGLEYRHYDFDATNSIPHDITGAVQVASNKSIEPTLDSVTLRLSWKFDRPEPVAPPMK
jgi:outer membrane immunogenic protein